VHVKGTRQLLLENHQYSLQMWRRGQGWGYRYRLSTGCDVIPRPSEYGVTALPT